MQVRHRDSRTRQQAGGPRIDLAMAAIIDQLDRVDPRLFKV